MLVSKKLSDTHMSSVILPVFQKIIQLFVTETVFFFQLRKDYLRVVKRNKTMALCLYVGSLYANRIFMYFCIKSSIGTQAEAG